MRSFLTSLLHWSSANILLVVVVFFILGITAANNVATDGSIYLSIAFTCTILTGALLALMYRRNASLALFSALPFFFCIGFIHTSLALAPPDDPNHIYNLIQQRSKVTVTGTLVRMVEYDGSKSRFELSVDEVRFPAENFTQRVEPARGLIRLSMRGKLSADIIPGTTLMLIATLDRLHNYQTPGAFDYRGYMASRSIYCSGWVKSEHHILRVRDVPGAKINTLRYLPERLRQQIGLFLHDRFDQTTSGLYQALLIGTRSGVSPQTLEQFKATGCMHLLAISGLHMSLLGLMISLSASWLMKRSHWLLLRVHVPTIAVLVTLPPLAGYAFIAGMNTPVFRALVMAMLFLLTVVLKRQRSLIHLIAAAALFLLALNPLVLFTVSFQLSFSAVFAIAVIYPKLLAAVDRFNMEPKQNLPARISLIIQSALLVSFAATLGTLPFMLYHFNRFSPLGPVMNLLIEPLLCFWALPVGLVATPLIFITPDIAALLFKMGSIGILAADRLTASGSLLPGASLWTITPLPIEIAGYFIVIALWIHHKQVLVGKWMAAGCSTILLLIFTSGLWLPQNTGISKISYIDVGQGTSTLMQLPGGKKILLDGGGSWSPRFDVGERVIAPFLWKQRIWRLNDAIITHPHSDHFNGMGFVLQRFHPKRLYINGHTDGEDKGYQELMKQAGDLKVRTIVAQAGLRLFSEKTAELTCIGMNGLLDPGKNFSVNDQSLVFKLRHGRRSFLFPADITIRSEAILLDSKVDLAAEVLLAPHHGSVTSSSNSFIAAVDPQLIVVSASRRNQGRFPTTRHLARWHHEKRESLVTAINGSVTCLTDGDFLHANTFSGNDFQL